MGGKGIGPDVHVMKKNLTTSNFCIAVLEIGPSKSQRFDLRTEQDHARLIFIQDEIIVTCLSILAYSLCMGHGQPPNCLKRRRNRSIGRRHGPWDFGSGRQLSIAEHLESIRLVAIHEGLGRKLNLCARVDRLAEARQKFLYPTAESHLP